MTIYTLLKKDHATVEELFAQISNSKGSERKETLFAKLKRELLLHAEVEHRTFYKELKKHKEMKDLISHADKEHKEIENYCEKINKSSVQSDQWLIYLGELKHAVLHHVKQEEGEIFKEARKILSKEEEQKIADAFQTEKENEEEQESST